MELGSKNLDVIYPYAEDYKINDSGTRYEEIGKNALSYNQFGVVILSGGQGTRLGFNGPKGLYKIDNRELFSYHVDKIKNVIRKYKADIKLLIMTSDFTHDAIVDYFTSKQNFGLKVEFFKQDNSVCVFDNGEPIRYFDKIVESPNGNGNIFKSIRNAQIDNLYAINVISVDNILANILDPISIGILVDKKLDIVSKSVSRHKDENMGVFTKVDGRIQIQEYSELQDTETNYEGNICNHLFKTEFVKQMYDVSLPIHRAHKKIPYTIKETVIRPNKPNGYKNETFIFDSFLHTTRNGVMHVCRQMEFAPLKNGVDSATDNPKTCTQAYNNYVNHIKSMYD